LQTDESGEKALSITWQKQIAPSSYVDLPCVYCLRSNQTQWPEEQLWRTYMMLTNLEAVFRCLKVIWVFGLSFIVKKSRLTVTCSSPYWPISWSNLFAAV
jgi:hypothetical protein